MRLSTCYCVCGVVCGGCVWMVVAHSTQLNFFGDSFEAKHDPRTAASTECKRVRVRGGRATFFLVGGWKTHSLVQTRERPHGGCERVAAIARNHGTGPGCLLCHDGFFFLVHESVGRWRWRRRCGQLPWILFFIVVAHRSLDRRLGPRGRSRGARDVFVVFFCRRSQRARWERRRPR